LTDNPWPVRDSQREFAYTRADFDRLRQLSRDYSGIQVPDDKFDMFYSRLAKRLRALGLSTFRSYVDYLSAHPDLEFTEFINSVTTNLTAFFRENHHFEFLAKQALPQICKQSVGRKTLSAWSAGCSTGEEAYSLAMTLHEHLPGDWRFQVLATDLDTQVLRTAAAGVYPLEAVARLGERRLKQWFQKGVGRQDRRVRVKAELREAIEFRQLNLMRDWPELSGFDLIFCRNVLIYFDRSTKEALAKRYWQALRPGGYLFIGHSESLHQLDTGFEALGQTVYRKPER